MLDVEEGIEVAFEAIKELPISLEKPSCGRASGWTQSVRVRVDLGST
jgi:hypothetical protein